MIPLGVLGSAREVASTGGAYYTAVMADSPVAFYPLGDSSAPPVDATGTTTATASNWPTFGAAGIGDAATSADFDGVNDTFTIGQPAALNNLSAFTVEALVTTGPTGVTIIASRDNTSTQRSWLLYRAGGGTLYFAKVVNGSLTVNSSLSIPSDGSVSHVAATYDGTTVRTYVNGTAGTTGTTSGTLAAPTVDVTIGSRNAASHWDGRIAGFAVYNSTLSAARILAHAQAAGVA